MSARSIHGPLARRVLIGLAVSVLIVGALFTANGLSESWRVPRTGTNGHSYFWMTDQPRKLGVRVMAFNAAKGWFHRGGLDFANVDEVRANLDRVASVIRDEDPDVVCLSEVVMEAAPNDLDQVEYLARACGFAQWASAENYNFGVPWFRIRSGNAVLSNFEMRALEVQQLAGGTSFWSPTGNRRALWFEIRLNGEWLLGASIRNDSFDLVNNGRQVEELLARIGDRPALVAGDFNAAPGTPPMERWLATGRFAGFAAEPATFPAHAPTRRIDQLLAPVAWRVIDQRVVDTGVSDHLAVVVTFALPE